MEKLTNKIAGKIAVELKLDNDNKEVIAYGIFAMLDIALSILLIVIFGLIFHVLVEALIVCFTGSILRKYSGGAHASSPGKCAAIGTIICIGQAMLFTFLIPSEVNTFTIPLIGIFIFLWSYYLIYKLAPVDSAAKPIRTKEKQSRMKKGSFFTLSLFAVIIFINTVIFIFFKDKKIMVYSLCLYGGIVWQTFTLTKAGHKTMHKMDSFLNHILIFSKGGR